MSRITTDPARRLAARAAARLEWVRYNLSGVRHELREIRVGVEKGSLSVPAASPSPGPGIHPESDGGTP